MDIDDFRKLALSEMDAVYRLAYHLAGHPQEADDLVQETYLRAFKFGAGFKAADHGVRPWLFKILHNVVNSRHANDHRRRQVMEDLQDQAAPEAAAHDGPLPDLSTLNWDAVDERLKAAIDELPLPHREVFLLCAVEGLRYREIADVMEVPLGTIMSRLYRARAQLSSRLTELAAERGFNKGGQGPPGPSPGKPGGDAPQR